jgi:thiol-disulfide isomerase/thioredoxin
MRLFAATLISIGVATAVTAEEGGIPWITSYEDALVQLKVHKKPLFIEFYADWCGPCKQMDAEVYSQPEVVEALEHYAAVKIDVDAAMNVAAAYQVNSIPRFIVVSVDENVVGDTIGSVSKDYFLTTLDMIEEAIAEEIGGQPMPNVQSGPAAQSGPDTPTGPSAEDRVAEAEGLDDWLTLLGDIDPATRKTAGSELADRGSTGAWILVEALASDYLGTRIGAYEALSSHELSDLPFDPWAPLADRKTALKAWRVWRDAKLTKPVATPATPAVQ